MCLYMISEIIFVCMLMFWIGTLILVPDSRPGKYSSPSRNLTILVQFLLLNVKAKFCAAEVMFGLVELG